MEDRTDRETVVPRLIEGLGEAASQQAVGPPILAFYDKSEGKFSYPQDPQNRGRAGDAVRFVFTPMSSSYLQRNLELGKAGKPILPRLITEIHPENDEVREMIAKRAMEHNTALIMDFLSQGGEAKDILYSPLLPPNIEELLGSK